MHAIRFFLVFGLLLSCGAVLRAVPSPVTPTGGGGTGDVTEAELTTALNNAVAGLQPSGDYALTEDLDTKLGLVPADLDTGTVISAVADTLNTNTFSTGTSKTYTFSGVGDVHRPYYLELTNSTGVTFGIKLTAPGGTTLFSVERNSAFTADGSATDFSLSAGQVLRVVFTPVSGTRINVTGVPAPLNWLEELQLTHPHQVDGTGATMNVTASLATYGHATFSHSADQAANYVIYRIGVPADFDSSVDLQASFVFRLGGADTATHRYVISMADVADSASTDAPTFINPINLDFAADASGASADRASVTWTTLTSWRTSLTAGRTLAIKVARDGDATEDASTTASSDQNLKLKIGHTQ
jgi:hypothetical protein